jgi:ABC-type cobalt transport system substrate-binding protein
MAAFLLFSFLAIVGIGILIYLLFFDKKKKSRI